MKKIIVSLICLASLANTSSAETRVNDSSSTVSRADEVYRALVKEGKVPASVLHNAKCIAVFPSVVTIALGVGGLHGDGVAFCKTKGDNWGSPVFLDLNGASLGVQAGAKSADMVFYLLGEKSREGIEKGSFTFTGELSAVAGKFEEHYTAPTTGVIGYGRTGGVFAGAMVEGVSLSHDDDEQKAFYGTYDANNLFEGKIPQQVAGAVTELKKMLPS